QALDLKHLIERDNAGTNDARCLFEHDLFRKPVPTFRDHAPSQWSSISSSTQARMMWWAMAMGGGVVRPAGCMRSSMLATSSRSNQRASSSSDRSMMISRESASAWNPIISELGKGHGCEAK